jgi:hypothetical protein
MNFWARNGHDNRTYSILRMMQDDFCAGNVKAKPDRHAYNTVLAAFSRSKEKDASKKAEKLFHEMKNSASEGDPDLEPDIYTMNTSKLQCTQKQTKGLLHFSHGLLAPFKKLLLAWQTA